MILVTVGVSNLPFDRLLTAVDGLTKDTEKVIVQCGAARIRPQRATCFDYLPFAKFEEFISEARVVVCHAGIGSVGLCLSAGVHPLVVPRLKRLGESVDDHQLLFARRLDELGLATAIDDVAELGSAVRTAPGRQAPTGLSAQLAEELIAYISRYAGRRGNGPAPDE
jgi:beta-1,4-N-acetylglucosaminyltransferase